MRGQRKAVMTALKECPGTSADVAAHSGLPLRHCSAILSRLWARGLIERSPTRVRSPGARGYGAYVYSRKTLKPWTTGDERRLREIASKPRLSIAHELGRSQRAIVDRARLLGVELTGPFRGRWDAAAVRRAKRLRDDGVPVRVMAESTGIPLGTLRHWFYDGYRSEA